MASRRIYEQMNEYEPTLTRHELNIVRDALAVAERPGNYKKYNGKEKVIKKNIELMESVLPRLLGQQSLRCVKSILNLKEQLKCLQC